MQIDSLAVRLRPRTPVEAADLGVRLCQHTARSVYTCYAMVAVPLMVFALALFEIADWLPSLIIFWSKPWFDRTILFVLSRAAFGQATTPADVWRAQRVVWWRRFLFSWTVRRISLWRSLTEAVYQLEGLSIREAMPRVRQIRRGKVGTAFVMTQAFAWCEIALEVSLISLLFWFAPSGHGPDLEVIFAGEMPASYSFAFAVTYGLTVLFLEPFYVAAGFAMYLTRRAELEAWDIEQEFRRAFAR